MPKVTAIPPTKTLYTQQPLAQLGKKRVAAYARVSTDLEQQQSSYKIQMDYFTEFITSNPEWEFAGLYADEGITATSMKNRDGFNSMIADAMDGKIDSIITKSVSRFARNTVDSLTTIRQLKEKGIDVYFEKENIHTLDAKGELLITIMSSMAQEESRSISENCTWGIRKRMKEGTYKISYSNILGYEPGPNGKPIINEEEAKIVRRIYSDYIGGKSSCVIARELEKDGVPTTTGEGRWDSGTVISILKNEKYKGDALIQKSFTKDYLSHKSVKNRGELPSYYIEDDHAPIISKEAYELAQIIRESRKKKNAYRKDTYCNKLICGECGAKFKKCGRKTKDGKEALLCYNRYGPKHLLCATPSVYPERVEEAFLEALNIAIADKDKVLQKANRFIKAKKNTAALEKESNKIREEMADIIKTVSDGSTVVIDRISYKAENEELYDRHAELGERLDEISTDLKQRKVDIPIVEAFVRYFTEMDGTIKKFDKFYWEKLLDKMIVNTDNTMTVVFYGGYKVKV